MRNIFGKIVGAVDLLNEGQRNEMISKFKQLINTLYSLYDMIINKIVCNEESLHLKFITSYITIKALYKQISGNIIIENVGIDSCYVSMIFIC